MRAHLILNPEARRVTPAMQRVVAAALEARFKLSVTVTHEMGAGLQVARDAVDAGDELLIAFGGDGLVNEVVNGIVDSAATLAVIPGGTMNVFARNLGLSNDPMVATDLILRKAGNEPASTVSLAKLDDRYFTFAAGCGFDAEAAARVEQHRHTKRRFGEPYFYAAALITFLKAYRHKEPFLTCTSESGERKAVMAIALNGGPYAYLLGRPVRLSQGQGLDLFTLERMRYWAVPLYGVGALASGWFGPDAQVSEDNQSVDVAGEEPFLVHVDGEPLTPRTHASIVAGAANIEVLT